jgi:hypothetical protein
MEYLKYKDSHKHIDNKIYKLCKDCREWFELNESNFRPDTRAKDGFNNRCHTCQIKYAEEYYNKTRDTQITSATKRNKENGEDYLAYLRNWHQENLEYHRNQNNQWYADNKPYRQEYTANWRQENPDRVKYHSEKHRDHDISTKEWNSCLKVFNHKCVYCGITEKEHKETIGEKLHKDHKDHDGYNDIRNAIPACKSCNSSKHTDDMEKWFREQSFFSVEKLNKILWWITEGYKEYIEDKTPYKLSRKRIYNEDGSYNVIHELWSVDEQRNTIECLAIGKKKKDLNKYIEEMFKL